MSLRLKNLFLFLTALSISQFANASILIPEFATDQTLIEQCGTIDHYAFSACNQDAWMDDDYSYQPAIADPLEWLNRPLFQFNDFLYTNALLPLTEIYKTVVPNPVRNGVGNFFDNLKFPIRLVNSALQLKGDKAIEETEKFLINTTIGVLGIMTPAQDNWGIDPSGEDMGQTFGHYGIDHGAYLVIPFLGPTSLRDFIGRIGDGFLSPINYTDDDEVRMWGNIIEIINDMPDTMDMYFQIKEGALDPYSSIRNGYAQIRKQKVAQ